MKALQRPSINTVGVYGDDGIGKTMLVREMKRRAEKEKLFDVVVMATVRMNPDLPRIQHEIACGLGLDRVTNEYTSQGASNLEKARQTEKKVLLILDDVWQPEMYSKLRERLPLVDEKEDSLLSYKILLTSTERAVLSNLSEEQFEIHPLEEKENWELFKKIAIDQDESIPLPFYAEEEIVSKCNQLPIAVTTLAKALKSRNPVKWKATYRKLQSYSHYEFLHSTLELNYGLKSEELQQTFLLCCLMGHNAAIEDLLKYAVGLGWYQGVDSIEEARDKVSKSVSELKKSSLLLDSGSNIHFDMHDLVRNFAIWSIAFGEVELDSWSTTMESIKWIYLSNAYGHDQLPDESNCPGLTFFHLSQEDPSKPIPPNFFSEMEQLKVLGLTKTWSVPGSISLLKNLNTLCLDQSVLAVEKLGSIIQTLNLQVLSLVGCNIEELPYQIMALSNLKLLDLSDCNKLKIIPRGVLSRLYSLQELYMRNSFRQWVMEGVNEQEKSNASLSELERLPRLTAIEVGINIPSIEMININLFRRNLARYVILVGDMWHSWDSSYGSSKMLKLKLDAKISSEHPVKKLLKKTEELHLQGLSGVNNVVNELDEESFQELKYLFIQDAQNVQHIITSRKHDGQHIITSRKHDGQNVDQDSRNSIPPAFPVLEVLVLRNLEKMEKICHGLVGGSSFSKLIKIEVEFCNQLKNLFSSSIAKRNLLQLQEIRVIKCSNMEEIVDDDKQGGENDILKELRFLRLEDLPKLNAFYCSCKRMTLFREQVASFSAAKLMKLIIKGCDNLECIFSSSMARGLNMLKHLEIRKCSSMKEVIFTDNNVEEKIIFPQLNILEIKDLEDLVNFNSGNCIVEFKSLKKLQVLNCPKLEGFIANTQTLFNQQVKFPNLEFLRLSSINIKQIWHISSNASVKNLKKLLVEGCGNLEYLLTCSMVKSFEQLMVLKISNCKMMEGVINEEERMCEISFPELDTLELEDLPKLTRFCLGNSNATINSNPAASIEKICDCEMMEEIIHSEESKEETISFPELHTLELIKLPKCTRFYHAENTDTPFLFNEKVGLPKLKFLSLSSIDNLKYLLTSSIVKSFEQFMALKICDCKMIEQVIISNELVEEEKMCESFFSKLDTLELEDLPKLARLSGRICHMLPARHLVIWRGDNPAYWRWFKPDPRFPEVAEALVNIIFQIHGRISTRMLSPKTRYKAYLVFKLADKPDGFKNKPIEAAILLGGAEVSKRNVYELQAESEIVGNGDHFPQERGDNWLEVELGEIEFTKERGGDLEIYLEERIDDNRRGVIIQGMEIRPT
ncbi:hypothetical protein SLEP1_g14928 [Rubroshorea leprosula]|uniref:NB-ARC domain-containing protein n=1 Tax=Rubroshorea leprosula TaxID=152421 RepID=A0AAV5IV88_9ROSI|nr:hypothetical protein SLEP1_g14928 [Rubroshorea leprosula]